MKTEEQTEADARLEELSKMGDPLEKLNKYIGWEDFREKLSEVFKKEAKGPGGRPHYDYVMMFKILILQKLYNLSDDASEYIIKDRLSFQRFLGLSLCDKVADAKTIWLFREALRKANVIEEIFDMFVKSLEEKKIITRSGSIVDASFVEVPRQRNSREENEEIKRGKVPEAWEKEENRHKRAQKDTDARWAVKNKEVHYGYKNHIKIDKKSKIIIKYSATSAEVHDSQELKSLIEQEKDRRIYGDSAYTGEEVQKCIPEKTLNRIHEKGHRNRPLSKTQKRNNRAKSKIRARVEHIFAAMHHFGARVIRSIGIARAKVQIGLLNLTYNLTRYAYIKGAKA